MGYTKEYLMWLLEKYGDDEEDMDDVLERLGEDTKPFGRMREFSKDILTETVERERNTPPRWDVFISYASEHKEVVARPLAALLKGSGLKIWYDEVEYPNQGTWNGILYRFIHEGIALSKFGVVIVSPEYVNKDWTMEEYYGLRLKEASRIFLVLHNTTSETLNLLDSRSATDFNRKSTEVASTGENSIKEIAQKIVEFVKAFAKN